MIHNTAILIPYFGTQPSWFDFFLLSCSKNSMFEWYFFSDCLKSSIHYENTHFIAMDLSQFNSLASKRLNAHIQIKHPYKLCDLKPAFGLIFYEYIADYCYWGYGDIDLVYGDISSLLPQNWMNDYDIIVNDKNFVPGHFCIMKNTHKMRELFKEVQGYEKIFQTDSYLGFDEVIHPVKVNFKHGRFQLTKHIKIYYHLCMSKLKTKYFLKPIVAFRRKQLPKAGGEIIPADFSGIVNNNIKLKLIKAYVNRLNTSDIYYIRKCIKSWVVYWRDGILTDGVTGEQLMYFHFQLVKDFSRFKCGSLTKSCSSFILNKKGIKAVG